MARAGAWVIGVGVAIDIPPHVLPHTSLEFAEWVGHLVVLAGMAVVLAAVVLLAVRTPRSDHRRSS